MSLPVVALLLTAVLAPAGTTAEPAPVFTDAERARILQHSPLGPPPPDPSNAYADDDRAARLGQMLFFETRLSPGGVACATCHVPSHSFADGRKVSRGMKDGVRHTPSLWNVAYNRWLFWDGRRDSLWAQALVPMESEAEMGTSRPRAARLVADDVRLRAAYSEVFGPLPEAEGAAVDRIYSNLGKAIEAYERRLLSRRAPFDLFVEGLRDGDPAKLEAVGVSAQRGLRLFVGRASCRQCHSGPNFTDGEFHRIGVPPGGDPPDTGRYGGIDSLLRDPFNTRGRFSDETGDGRGDRLRYLRRSPEAWGQFKTPSLRNVTRTAPYMHRGQIATLEEVLRHYSTLEGVAPGQAEGSLVPLHLTELEKADVIAFLESLTDESIDPALTSPPPATSPQPSRAAEPGSARCTARPDPQDRGTTPRDGSGGPR